MATVVISNELMSIVKANISRFFSNQMVDLPKPQGPLPKARSEVLSLLYGENWEVYDKLVSGPIKPFVLHTTSIHVCVYPIRSTNYVISLLDECPGPIFIPALEGMASSFTEDITYCYHPAIVKFNPALRYYNNNKLHIQAERLVLEVKPIEAWAPILEPVIEYQDRARAIIDERDTTLKAAHNLLSSHRTLGPCLRAWPSLWDFLPEATKAKHMRKTENTKQRDSGDEISNEEKAALQKLDVSLAIKRLKGEV